MSDSSERVQNSHALTKALTFKVGTQGSYFVFKYGVVAASKAVLQETFT